MFNLVVLLLATTPIFVSSQSVLRIAGGNKAFSGSIPYQVSLRLKGFGHDCGGSIITPRAILSAAHCFETTKPDQWEAVVGTNQLNAGGQTYGIRKIVAHEKFDKTTYRHDIAIVFTDEDIQFSDRVQPIELNDEPVQEGEELLVSGWGQLYAGGPTPNNLMELYVNVVSYTDCKSVLATKKPIYKTEICALAEPGRGSCSGDSGGPLAEVTGRKLVGIVSSAIPCGTGVPDLYTNVYSYLPWIKKTLLREEMTINAFLKVFTSLFKH
ncbi:chymotrypsin-2-like [Aricia agestis]|uniref:chymotrypsin-2-like n=1 Tax=Aricia agestis TaxID=91739 RepID=UPI001C202EAA|nr:chymotrypsin-2-like [Aricia agestis]